MTTDPHHLSKKEDLWAIPSNIIDQINPVVLIFLVLCINCLSYVPFSNEEQYLLYARQHFNPDWMPNSFMANEFPGNRLLYEWLFGWMVHWFGFETTIFVGRLLNFALLAIPLAGLFRLLNFSNTDIFILLQAYLMSSQNFYAGEWIFKGMEAKTFAYIFVFWALLAFLKNRYYQAIGLTVLATWFHILIGGWFAICCFLVLLIKKVAWKDLIKMGLLFAIPLLPLLYYLSKNLLIETPDEVAGVNLDHIYVYFRNRHHIGLFYDFGYFFKKHAFGVSLAILAVLFFFKKKYAEATVSTLKTMMLVMLSIGFVFLGISLMDKLFFNLSGGFLLKSYPWRMQGLAFLICFMLLWNWVKNSNPDIINLPKITSFLILICLLFGFNKLRKNISGMLNYQNHHAYNEALDFLKAHTKEGATVMVLNHAEDLESGLGYRDEFSLDLIRRTERDNFVVYKFVPGGTLKLYEWYKRLLLVNEIRKNPNAFSELTRDYQIDYVLTEKGYNMPLERVFENEAFQIYKK